MKVKRTERELALGRSLLSSSTHSCSMLFVCSSSDVDLSIVLLSLSMESVDVVAGAPLHRDEKEVWRGA